MPALLPALALLLLLAAGCGTETPADETGPEDSCVWCIDDDTGWVRDDDGDGWTVPEGDCDDDDPAIHPGAEEIPYDGIDQDCTGSDLTDVDGDGYDAEKAGGDDCDDGDAAVNPEAEETWYDGVDQDCGAHTGSDYDADGDQHDAEAYGGDDCYDRDARVYPGATEACTGMLDEDCDTFVDCEDPDCDGVDPCPETTGG